MKTFSTLLAVTAIFFASGCSSESEQEYEYPTFHTAYSPIISDKQVHAEIIRAANANGWTLIHEERGSLRFTQRNQDIRVTYGDCSISIVQTRGGRDVSRSLHQIETTLTATLPQPLTRIPRQ